MSESLDRRSVLRHGAVVGAGAAAVSLVGCSSTSTTTPVAGATSAGAKTLVKKSEIPVGGGKILSGLVVTQPTAGSFKAFSSVCTHQGCQVSAVQNNKIICACHDSMFDASSGAPVGGPAKVALAAKTVTDAGEAVTIG
ncbi:MAG: Rieske (2Fe-2S) protein [Dermatophilaceae bacterium]